MYHLEDLKPPKTPMKCEELCPSDEKATPQDIYRYQWKVGSLLYATMTTRPDAAHTANKLSEFLRNPFPHHQAAVDRAISYLYGTRTLAIEYSGTTNGQEAFACASDVAFADDILTRHSTEGYLFKLFGGAVDWRSTKQKTVTISTTEAEDRKSTRLNSSHTVISYAVFCLKKKKKKKQKNRQKKKRQ